MILIHSGFIKVRHMADLFLFPLSHYLVTSHGLCSGGSLGVGVEMCVPVTVLAHMFKHISGFYANCSAAPSTLALFMRV